MTVGELCAALLDYGGDREVEFEVSAGGEPMTLREATVSASSPTGEREDVVVTLSVTDGVPWRIPF